MRPIETYGAVNASLLDWPARFKQRYGRKPRVLHVGNVANYAYVNAKIQRAHGIDAYVMDPDFYHIMASPEWIEVEIEGDHGDDFRPSWSQVDLHGYKPPPWFVQAPFKLCMDYLSVHMTGHRLTAMQLRTAIDFYRHRGLAASAPTEDAPPTLKYRTLAALGKVYGCARRLLPSQQLEHRLPEIVDSEPPTITVETVRTQRDSYFPTFAQFDIVQGYTISAYAPLAVGHPNVVAYELGTIRGLPFEDSEMGRTTAWVYKTAPAVIITNVDCVPAADKLGIEPSRRELALHAYDVERAMAFSKAPLPSPHSGATPYFFAPARHHWKRGNLSWLKGNDVIIRAAGMLKRAGYDFRIVFVRWGQELDLSEDLIAEENLVDNIVWIQPQPVVKLWRVYCGAVAVVDQFRAQAFGGVALDSMALGRRLITAYDEELGSHFFARPPPIDNVKDANGVYKAMASALADPEDTAGRGTRLQDWFRDEHGIAAQLAPQFRLYEKLLERNGPAQIGSR